MYVEDHDFKEQDDNKEDAGKQADVDKNKTTADDRSEKGTDSEAEETSKESFPASDPPSF